MSISPKTIRRPVCVAGSIVAGSKIKLVNSDLFWDAVYGGFVFTRELQRAMVNTTTHYRALQGRMAFTNFILHREES